MKRIKLLFATLALAVFGVGGTMVLSPAAHAASPKQVVCTTLDSDAECDKQSENGISINKVISAAIRILGGIIGVVSVIMIMVAGFKYITSAGDASKASSAKNTLLYAVIGLVVAFLAQAIVSFVLNKVNS
jgi:hypothetical protein